MPYRLTIYLKDEDIDQYGALTALMEKSNTPGITKRDGEINHSAVHSEMVKICLKSLRKPLKPVENVIIPPNLPEKTVSPDGETKVENGGKFTKKKRVTHNG